VAELLRNDPNIENVNVEPDRFGLAPAKSPIRTVSLALQAVGGNCLLHRAMGALKAPELAGKRARYRDFDLAGAA
jgi:hypothetical protein